MQAVGLKPDQVMPPLRADVSLIANEGGVLLHDEFSNRYFRLSVAMGKIVEAWQEARPEAVLAKAQASCRMELWHEDVEATYRFLLKNGLLLVSSKNSWKEQVLLEQKNRQGWLMWLIHNYLFVKIPLVRPTGFLQASLPLISGLFSRKTLVVLAFLVVLDMYLLSRQWDAFSETFVSLISMEGLIYYGASLVVVKVLHELGHAYMATRLGLRVPTMGIAFMVLMPILYTDTTDAWRLASKRQRLLVDGVGILVELAIAAIATLVWFFAADGAFKTAAFAMATTGWILSLFVNLNPFMRFDGYFVLSDMLGVENLQQKGFALGRWKLRQFLFGIDAKAPVAIYGYKRIVMIAHAWGTWIYRFFLFLGIALLVYHFFIKVVGIVLFVIEIAWFIALPLFREFKEWYRMRKDIASNRRFFITVCILVCGVIALLLPWSGTIKATGVVEAQNVAGLYAPEAAQIASLPVARGGFVHKGEPVLVLKLDDIAFERQQVEAGIALAQGQVDRAVVDETDRQSLLMHREEVSRFRNQKSALAEREEQLVIRAPFGGVLVEVDASLREGLWVNPDIALGRIRSGPPVSLIAYVPEQHIDRLKVGDTGWFVPDDPVLHGRSAVIEEMSETGVSVLDQPYASMLFGGDVPVASAGDAKSGLQKPLKGTYRVRLKLDEPLSANKAVRGRVHLYGKRESAVAGLARRIIAILIRETGF